MVSTKHQIGIVGDISKIYQSLHELSELEKWWATNATGKSAVGETINLGFSTTVTLSFKLVELQEDALIHMECVYGPNSWLGSDLKFYLRQDSNQVWVQLEHKSEAASEDDFLYFNTKWPCYLLSLRDLIETGKGRPYPNDVKIHLGD